MIKSLTLQNFRNYPKRSFAFGANATLIVGPNAVGKTNILEAIYILATGRSFRAENERELQKEGQPFDSTRGKQVSRVVGQLDSTELEIIWDQRGRFQKLYRVNGVGKRVVDFVGNLRVVLFSPQDIEIVADSPSTRRRYLDSVLSLVHRDYRQSLSIYERVLRQRNKLLYRIREERLPISAYGEQIEYWNQLSITYGTIIYQRRKEYFEFLNGLEGEFFPIRLDYNHSVISPERLEKYREAEIAAAMTLVGPHRDDFVVAKSRKLKAESRKHEDLRLYGSRGEQRMAVFTIKLGELEYVNEQCAMNNVQLPVLLLDDIFSELDHENRHRLLKVIPKQQTIMTTTDLHLVEASYIKHVDVIKLGGG